MGKGLLTYYDVLRIGADADARAIRGAYVALMRKYHPDNCLDNPDYGHYHSSRVNEAYRVLGDPVRRSNYDTALARLHYNRLFLFIVFAWERGARATGDLGRAAWRGAGASFAWLRHELFGPHRRQAYRAAAAAAVRASSRLVAATMERLAQAWSAGRPGAALIAQRSWLRLRRLSARATDALGSLARRVQAAIAQTRPLPRADALRARWSAASAGVLARLGSVGSIRLSGAHAAWVAVPLLTAAFVAGSWNMTGSPGNPGRAPQIASASHAAAAGVPSSDPAPGDAPLVAGQVQDPAAGEPAVPRPIPAVAAIDSDPRPAAAELQPQPVLAAARPAQPQLAASATRAPAPIAIAQDVPPAGIAVRRSEAATPQAPPPSRSRQSAPSPQRACFDAIVAGPEAYRACLQAQAGGD